MIPWPIVFLLPFEGFFFGWRLHRQVEVVTRSPELFFSSGLFFFLIIVDAFPPNYFFFFSGISSATTPVGLHFRRAP